MKKYREELLQSRILDDPLPEYIRAKHIDTNWVSPICDRMVPVEEHRQGLLKRTCESRKLKMELPPMHQSKSAPSLRGAVKLPKINAQQGGSGHDVLDVAASEQVPAKKGHGTKIVMEPPASLSNAVVLHRLEDHVVHFHQKSFGSYVKQFDISSGQKKHRMDPGSMRNAEDAYVSSLHALVGPASRPALTLYNSPERTFKKRMKKMKRDCA